MKQFAALLLALILCLLAAGALAEQSPVVRNGAIAAYIDGDGRVFIPGNPEAINTAPADGLIAIDAYRLLFTSADEAAGTESLYMIDLERYAETLLVQDVHAVALVDDALYYTAGQDRAQLMRRELPEGAAEVAYTAAEPIDRLYSSAEGLVAQLVDQAGALVRVRETGNFEPYNDALPRSGLLTESGEISLADTGDLYLRSSSGLTVEHIDSDVMAYALLEDKIYYLCHSGSAVRLKGYDPEAMTWQVVTTPEIPVESQLTASAANLYLLGTDRTLYQVNLKDGELLPVKRYADLTGYNLPKDYDVTGLRIEAMSGLLNVYASLEEQEALPDFTFIEFTAESDAAAPVLRLLDSLALEGEDTAWDQLKPAIQYETLSRGSRGDAVRAIQQPLYNLGYYDYIVDGIFGPRTEYAVRLLQSDLNQAVNGIADADLQRRILSGKLSAYDPYVALPRGSRGLRTQILQERLRDLGFLADAADGIFGGRTLKAVQLFQRENSLPTSETATRQTLQLLYAEHARPCASYIDLYPGDTGYRVRELNNRLKALYYLESNPGSTFTAETTAAIRMFQRMAGLPENGEASQSLLKALFAYNAPEAPGYILLKRGDENSRVKALQKRLKELKYYSGKVGGYFGSATRDAVALFQKKVGLNATGVATVRTQQLLFDDDAPVYVPPTVIGTPVISLDAYAYRENGAYYLTDDCSPTGYVTFSWETEGDVESYNVHITDEDGDVYVDNDTLLTRTGVSISTLAYDYVYTLQITAYPEDGDPAHITTAVIRFVRAETPEEPDEDEVAQVGIPVVSIDTTRYIESDITYVEEGAIIFHWYAEGQVASYLIEIRDESGNVLNSAATVDEQASIHSNAMTPGEIYTVTVSAIPVNGTLENARVKSVQFALPDVSLPEPESTEAPEVVLPTEAPAAEVGTPELAFDTTVEVIDGVSYLDPSNIVLYWHADGSVGSYNVEILDDNGEVRAHSETTRENLGVNAANMAFGEVYTLCVTAIPAGGTAADGAFASAEFALYEEKSEEESWSGEISVEVTVEPPTPPAPAEPSLPTQEPAEDIVESATGVPAAIGVVGMPEIALDTLVEIEDGVNYLQPDIISFFWHADGDVSAYHVSILDGDGEEIAHADTEQEGLSIGAEDFAFNEIYTLIVTAIPENGSMEDGQSASARFALYARPAETESSGEEETYAPEDAYEAGEEYEGSEEYEGGEEYDGGEEYGDESYDEASDSIDATGLVPEIDWSLPVTVDTDASIVQALQNRLVEWGWLLPEGYAVGQLDGPTLAAVEEFQSWYNDTYGAQLTPVNYEIPTIEADTLLPLMNDWGEVYMR